MINRLHQTFNINGWNAGRREQERKSQRNENELPRVKKQMINKRYLKTMQWTEAYKINWKWDSNESKRQREGVIPCCRRKLQDTQKMTNKASFLRVLFYTYTLRLYRKEGISKGEEKQKREREWESDRNEERGRFEESTIGTQGNIRPGITRTRSSLFRCLHPYVSLSHSPPTWLFPSPAWLRAA